MGGPGLGLVFDWPLQLVRIVKWPHNAAKQERLGGVETEVQEARGIDGGCLAVVVRIARRQAASPVRQHFHQRLRDPERLAYIRAESGRSVDGATKTSRLTEAKSRKLMNSG